MSSETTAAAAAGGLERPEASTENRSKDVGRRVTVDSLWLIAGYAVTSGAGFLFWIVAARVIPPERLGFDTAIYSIFTASAAIASSGIGNALLVMLVRVGTARTALLRLGILSGLLVALVTGGVAGLFVVLLMHPHLPPFVTIIGVALASAVWTLFVIKDPIMTALGGAKWTLTLNGPANVLKLCILPAIVVVANVTANPVLVAALIPAAITIAISYLALIPRLMRDADRGMAEPASLHRADRRSFGVFVLRDGTANGLYLGGILVLPFLVTALAGGQQGALFALCLQISSVLDLVGLGISTSLATRLAADPETARHVAMRVWGIVVAVVGVGAVGIVVLSPFLLGLLGRFYVDAGGAVVLTLLVSACVCRTAYEVWGAVLRAHRDTVPLLLTSSISTAVLVVLVVVLTRPLGAAGAAASLLVITIGLGAAGLVGLLRGRATDLAENSTRKVWTE